MTLAYKLKRSGSSLALFFKSYILRRLTAKQPQKTPFCLKNTSKIVIFRYDRLGDLIVSVPLIQSISEEAPWIELILICSPANISFGRRLEFVDRIILKPKSLFGWAKTLIRLRYEKIDVVVDLNHAVTKHTLIAAKIISPNHVASPHKDGRWGVKTKELQYFDLMPQENPLGYSRPMSQIYLEILPSLDIRIPDEVKYDIPKPATPYVNQPYVMINDRGSQPGQLLSEYTAKRIIKYLGVKVPGIRVVMLPHPDDWHEIRAKYGTLSNLHILDPDNEHERLINLVAHATLLISPDTAHVHLAAAFSTPLIAIYKDDPIQVQQWYPITRGFCEIYQVERNTSLEVDPKFIEYSISTYFNQQHTKGYLNEVPQLI